MALDKVLSKIQGQINDLAPTLELFVEDSIQPSVNDCDNLQQQLTKLQESLAVYKYNKQEREISPSFNIHAKVSNTETIQEKKEVIKEIVKEELKHNIENKPEIITEENKEHSKKIIALSIGINDKFRFINELFNQNNGEYNIAMEQLGNVSSWKEAEVYLNSLKALYNWPENSEVVNYLFALVKKRFV